MEKLSTKQACEYLNITKSTLYRWMERYNFGPDEMRPKRNYFYKRNLDLIIEKEFKL